MSRLAVFVVACMGLALLLSVDLANGECCHAVKFDCPYCPKKCADDSLPDMCCGKGPCNIFCCNCDRGCRGVITKRDVDSNSFLYDDTAFQQIDLNGDSHVDEAEARTHLLSGACGNHTDKMDSFEKIFSNFDKNQDGKLTYHEINAAG